MSNLPTKIGLGGLLHFDKNHGVNFFGCLALNRHKRAALAAN
jgi:hypothetical protein